MNSARITLILPSTGPAFQYFLHEIDYRPIGLLGGSKIKCRGDLLESGVDIFRMRQCCPQPKIPAQWLQYMLPWPRRYGISDRDRVPSLQ